MDFTAPRKKQRKKLRLLPIRNSAPLHSKRKIQGFFTK
jgi:hypothetical protein